MNDDKEFPLGDDGDFGRGLDVIFGTLGLIGKLYIGFWICFGLMGLPILVFVPFGILFGVLNYYTGLPHPPVEFLGALSVILSVILLVLYVRRRGRY
jgi:membrane protein implicated in regulation of membrane protease activity